MYIIQSEKADIEKDIIHTDELDVGREIFLSWETEYQIWHDQWVTKGERPRFQVDNFFFICWPEKECGQLLLFQ